jgi:ketosteroid isomerase-like protein
VARNENYLDLMTVGRIFGLVAALVVVAGCSVQEPAPATGTTPEPKPTSRAAPSSAPKPAAATTASTKSAFCTDLQTFNVATLHYRASVGRAMRGQALDFAELRRLATTADDLGKELLDTLDPAERLAFVLHDMFALPFDEIAPIVGRPTVATRQLASRARRRIQGSPTVPDADLSRQREVVNAFFAAARGGDFDALVAVLDPDVVLRSESREMPAGTSRFVRGAAAVAGQALTFRTAGTGGVPRPALVNGAAGMVVTKDGAPRTVFAFTVVDGKIAEIDIFADPERLASLDFAVLD